MGSNWSRYCPPSGDYRLTIEADPKNRILELNDDDNTSCVLLRLNMTNQTLNVLNPNGCDDNTGGPVAVYSVAPDEATRNSVNTVMITGTGFTPGMGLQFENGSGPSPVASDITVVNGTTLTAIVTVKKGGRKRQTVWDVRVDSGMLVNGFTVKP